MSITKPKRPELEPAPRTPGEVCEFLLYSNLDDEVNKLTRDKGLIDGTRVIFTQEQIYNALRAQGIKEKDLDKATKVAIDKNLLNETVGLSSDDSKTTAYTATYSGLALYHMQLRRI